jgi:shikimate kinase
VGASGYHGTVTDRHVVLLGLMGTGKTSIGRIVAERLGRPLIDGDDVLAEQTGGRTAAQIADDQGLDALHEREAAIALEALASAEPAVIGPAASVCESAAVREALVGHDVVWLSAPAELLADKAVRKRHRPLIADGGDLVELFSRQTAVREPLILPLAALVVDVSTVDDDAAAALIVERLSA